MRSITRSTILVAIGIAVCLSPPAPAAAAEPLELARCRVPGVEGKARCGKLRVFENRRTRSGRTIDLNVVVLPATGRDRAPDSLFFLHGGPGAPASAVAPLFADSPLRERRDIVLVDQRGTGKSNPLNCPLGTIGEVLGELGSFSFEEVEACRDALDADLSLYTTSVAMDDLDDVRAALKLERINLMGASYGTRAALEYIRRHGEHVRTATLRGVYPTSENLPLNFDRDSQTALFDVLDDCGRDAGCRAAFPDLREKLDEVLDRLEETPVSVKVRDPFAGGRTEVTVDRDLFVTALHYSLYASQTAARIPSFIQSAHDGDPRPAVDALARFAGALAPQVSMGMFLSVVCSEDVPFYDEKAMARSAKDTLLGGRMSRSLREVCEYWPRGEVPASYKEPVRSDVPTLIVSGEADPVTPPRLSQDLGEYMPNSRHIVLTDTGHSPLAPGCVGGLIREFVESGSVERLETSCTREIGRPAFRTDS